MNIKKLQFAVAVYVISIAKIWHDSFRSYITIASDLSSFLNPPMMLNMHTIGLTIGGAAAGIFTDSFTPKRVGLISMFGITFISFFLISAYIFSFDSYIRIFFILLVAVILFSLTAIRKWIFVKLDSFISFKTKKAALPYNASLMLSSIILALLSTVFGICFHKVVSYILEFAFTNGETFSSVCTYEIFILSFIIHFIVALNISIVMIISTAMILVIALVIGVYGIKSWLAVHTIFLYSPFSLLIHKLFLILTNRQAFAYLGSVLAALYCIPLAQGAMLSTRTYPAFSIISYVFIFFRAILVGSAMNSGYATIGALYKGSPFLSVATSVLYMFLFGILTVTPLCLKFVFCIKSFLILSCISFFISAMIFTWENTEPREFALFQSAKSMLTTAKNSNILLAAFVSMIFIGNFYNILSTFKYLSEINVRFYTMEAMQFIGRLFTFLATILIVFAPKKYKTNSNNCAKRIVVSLIVTILMSCSLIFASLFKYSGMFIVGIFCLNCLALGVAQSMAKALLLGAANRSNSNLCGSAQSVSTFANTFIEVLGCWILPFQCRSTYQIGILLYNLFIIISVATALIYTLLNKENVNEVLRED